MRLKEIVIDRKKLLLEQIESELAIDAQQLFDRLQELSNNFRTPFRYLDLDLDIEQVSDLLNTMYSACVRSPNLTETRAMIAYMSNYLQQ